MAGQQGPKLLQSLPPQHWDYIHDAQHSYTGARELAQVFLLEKQVLYLSETPKLLYLIIFHFLKEKIYLFIMYTAYE